MLTRQCPPVVCRLVPCICPCCVVVVQQVSLAQVFATVEANRDTYEIVDYAVSQTSLEQVFLGFARRQEEVNN